MYYVATFSTKLTCQTWNEKSFLNLYDRFFFPIPLFVFIFSSQRSCRALRMLIGVCLCVCDGNSDIWRYPRDSWDMKISKRFLRSQWIWMDLRSWDLRSWDLRSWDQRSWYLRSKILSWGPEIWDPETLRFEILRPWDLRSTDWILMFLLRAWDQRFLWSCFKKIIMSAIAMYLLLIYISIISTRCFNTFQPNKIKEIFDP